MTAEDFYNILEKRLLKKHSKRDVIRMMMSDSWTFIFAEAYHKAKIEAITDEEIHISFPRLPQSLLESTQISRDNYFKQLGAKWFKEKLLKQ